MSGSRWVASRLPTPRTNLVLHSAPHVDAEVLRSVHDTGAFGNNLIQFSADQEDQAGDPQPGQSEQGRAGGADDFVAGPGDAHVEAEAERDD